MQRFSVDTIRDALQLFRLLSSMSRELETLQQQLAALGSAKAIRISRSEIAQIRAALQHSGSAPLNVAGLAGLLSQSQRGYAVVATSAAGLPNPTLYEVGTLGAVISGGTTSLYVVQEGTPRSWLGPATFAAPANMMTTDTNQTPGATVVKTWTAQQIFNGGLTAAALVAISAGLHVGGSSDPGSGNLLVDGLIKLAGANASYLSIQTASEEITLSTIAAATDSSANLIPGNCLVLGAAAYITQTISGGGVTSWQLGDAITPSATRFMGTNLNLTAGNSTVGMAQWQGSVAADANGPLLFSPSKIRITTAGGLPTQGKVRVVVFSLVISPPTS